jgi:hypothetical protein
MLLNQALSLSHLLRLEAEICSQLHLGIDPEFRFAVGVLNVNVRSTLFTREEVEPETLHSQDRWTHRASIAHGARSDAASALTNEVVSGATK